MNDKKKRYLYSMLTGFGVIALSLILFFLIFRIGEIKKLFENLIQILMPFIYGAAFAYILKPVCATYEKWLNCVIEKLFNKKKEKVAAAIAVLGSILTAIVVIYFLISSVLPRLVDSILSIGLKLPDIITRFTTWVEGLVAENTVILNYVENALESLNTTLQNWLKTDLLPTMQSMMGSVSSGITSVITVMKNLMIGLIVAIYLLNGRKKFAEQSKLLLYSVCKEKWADWILRECDYADRMFCGFLSGKIIDSAIIGAICAVFCLIVQMPNTVLVSVIIGITNIIPFFGPFIGAVPSAILILIESPIKCIIFLVFIVILQQVDGNIIGPKILGNSTGLSSFWVLFSILLFGGLFGFIGMIIGVPLFAVIYDIVKQMMKHGLNRNNQLERLDVYEKNYKK